jgi:hypothetical protein
MLPACSRLADGGVAVGVHIRLAIGLIAALFVLRHWTPGASNAGFRSHRRDRHRVRRHRRRHHHAGQRRRPGWQIHLLPQKIEKLPYIGTVSILFAASNVVKMPGFLTLGYLTARQILIG